MFTGIVQAIGKIRNFSSSSLEVDVVNDFSGRFSGDFEEGESISVDGACLTLEGFRESGSHHTLRFHVSEETFRRTSLSERYSRGVPVNLERALRLCDYIGGHLVYGHVDGAFEVFWKSRTVLGITLSYDLVKFLPPKSSVAVNGVSLTVADVSGRTIYIHVIPETIRRTNLVYMKDGSRVNVEIDPLARYLIWGLSKSSI